MSSLTWSAQLIVNARPLISLRFRYEIGDVHRPC
jgi:hypothetical protein